MPCRTSEHVCLNVRSTNALPGAGISVLAVLMSHSMVSVLQPAAAAGGYGMSYDPAAGRSRGLQAQCTLTIRSDSYHRSSCGSKLLCRPLWESGRTSCVWNCYTSLTFVQAASMYANANAYSTLFYVWCVPSSYLLVAGAPAVGAPGGQGCHLFVCYMPNQWREQDMQVTFMPYGNMTECKIIRDRTTGESKGYGTCNFARVAIQRVTSLR